MKILVAQIIGYGSYGKGLMLEELQNLINEKPGAEIYYLTCSNTFNACYFNPYSKPEICYLCKEGKINSLSLIEGNFQHIKIEDLLRNEDKRESKYFVNNITQVKFDLRYENFKVGESALSTYISTTRDRDLELVEDSFVKQLIYNGVSLYIALKRFCESKDINVIYNFNGRHIYNRAVMDVGLATGIPIFNVELPRVGGAVEHFENVLPHTILYKQKLFNETWANSKLAEEEKINIASEYFIKRRSGTKVNARSFTEDQHKNTLPKDVDYGKNTVVLYTSSDDEFAAIGEEFSNPYFKDQNDGLFYVAKLFHEKFPDQNLIIRIHPNFAGVDFDYAKKIYALKGKYQNVHLVEPDSKVDSYALLDVADKVITFGSSITTEATFWQKPVIMLGKSFFSGMNVAYEPSKIDDLEGLLKNNLAPKPKTGSLKFGFYLIKGGAEANFYNRDNKGLTYFKGRRLYFYSAKQIIISKIIEKANRLFGIRIFVK
ncbi:capsular polysaccharide export protein, LipB/KpsS family [Salinimicrobium soli]|uniref:capsular polysaccharide export protein, LipB/KpsS family n=1 Tax=Salinimicrobium soli TaxID=1254399 RepID=UPI003AAF6D25